MSKTMQKQVQSKRNRINAHNCSLQNESDKFMKLNFIQNLSDEVIRQNHSLKHELVKLHQRIHSYEQQMLEIIATLAPHPHPQATPDQILKDFIREVRFEMQEHALLRMRNGKIKEQLEIVSDQAKKIRIDLINQDQKRSSLTKKWQEQKQEWQGRAVKLQTQLNQTKVTLDAVLEDMQVVKEEKLKLQEVKRDQIQDIRQYYHQQMMKLRQQNQKQFLKMQKKLRKQLQQKSKTIKQMSSSLDKLRKNDQLDQKDNNILQQMFKSFQQFDSLSIIIKDLRAEKDQLHETKTELQTINLNLEMKLRQCKAVEYNLLSMNERLNLQKIQIQNKLQVLMVQISKSQKDKQAMELYYDEKWNSEYKKVRVKLENNFYKKQKQIQEIFNRKVSQMELTISEARQKQQKAEDAANELQIIYQRDQNEKQYLNQQINSKKQQLKQKCNTILEVFQMSEEDVLTLRYRYELKIEQLNSKIIFFDQQIKIYQQKLVQKDLQHCRKIAQLQNIADIRLWERLKQEQNNKIKIQVKHQEELAKLKQEMNSKNNQIQQIRQQIQYQLQIKLNQQSEIFDRKIQQIQNQNYKKNQKWKSKFQQMEAIQLLQKKKYQEDAQNLKRQIIFLEKQLAKAQKRQEQNNNQKKQLLLVNQQQNKLIERLIIQKQALNGVIVERQHEIGKINKSWDSSKSQIQFLIECRKSWQQQLFEVQKQFNTEFHNLLKHVDKQKQIYMFKINQLEQLNNRRIMSKKDYQKMQELNTQRKQLKEEIHIKEAENVILSQVKNYYQTKLKDAQQKIGQNSYRTTHTILARKLKKSRMQTNPNQTSQRVFQPKQIAQKKRYVTNIGRRQYNLSLSKSKMEQLQKKSSRLPTPTY